MTTHQELYTLPNCETIEEVEFILSQNTEMYMKLRLNGQKLIFLRNTVGDEVYHIQKLENEFYGRVLYKGVWILSYPHLNNIKSHTELTMEASYLEEKVNGTNIGIGRYPHGDVIRTRGHPFPEEFPVTTFWNSTLEGFINEEIKLRLKLLRNEMVCKYPKWYINAGKGEYVGLKVQEVVNHIVNVDEILSTHSNYQFYFELLGNINPIIIDTEVEFGLYDYDYDMILIDIFDRDTGKFLNRTDKEHVAGSLNLKIVPVQMQFLNIKSFLEELPAIKVEAERQKIEGFVLKNGTEIVKVKPDIILNSAYKLNSIMKGYIWTPDLLNYISKIINIDYLSKPEEFENLIDMIKDEAKVDYKSELVDKNSGFIRKKIAESMAIMLAVKIMEEQTFSSKDDLFRYLNAEIPIRFEPLKSYIDFELEKSTTDVKLKKKMKRIRTELFSKIAKYCIKRLGVND